VINQGKELNKFQLRSGWKQVEGRQRNIAKDKNPRLPDIIQESILKRALDRKRSGYVHRFFCNEKILIMALERADLKLLHKHIDLQIAWPIPSRMTNEERILHDRSNAIRHIDDGMRIAIKHGVDFETVCCLGEIMMNDIHHLSSREEISSYAGVALELFIRQIQEVERSSYSLRVERCIQYIDQHIYEKLTVSRITAQQRVNADYLSRLFKKETGRSLSVFIDERKILEAKLLLAYTFYSVYDVAVMLSFKYVSHFSRMFKKFTGMTPSEYAVKYQSAL
jgi:AraC-like DNA-binding protein